MGAKFAFCEESLSWLGITPSRVFQIGVRRDSGGALLLTYARGRSQLMAGCGQPSADCRASLKRLLSLRLLRPFGTRNDKLIFKVSSDFVAGRPPNPPKDLHVNFLLYFPYCHQGKYHCKNSYCFYNTEDHEVVPEAFSCLAHCVAC